MPSVSLQVSGEWNKLAGEVVQLLSMEVFKKCVIVAIREMISGYGGDRLAVELGNLSGLFSTLMIL